MNKDNSFLRSIRTALGMPQGSSRSKETYPDLFAQPDTSELLAQIKERTSQEQQDLVEQCKTNAAEINLATHAACSHEEARNIIVELVRSKEPEFSFNKHIIQHDHPDLNALQLWKKFNREAITVHTSFCTDRQVREKTENSFIGITAPSLMVAESATLVQLTSAGCPRSTSLVPSIHIALVRQENFVATLEEAYAILGEKEIQNSFVFISGPSKTADIEAHMVHGAHGPRELHLIILAEQEQKEEEEVLEAPDNSSAADKEISESIESQPR